MGPKEGPVFWSCVVCLDSGKIRSFGSSIFQKVQRGAANSAIKERLAITLFGGVVAFSFFALSFSVPFSFFALSFFALFSHIVQQSCAVLFGSGGVVPFDSGNPI